MGAKIIAIKLIAYCSLLIAIIALIGNILSFYILMRKNFINTMFSFYFRVSIIFSILYLAILVDFYLEREWNIDFKTISSLTCKLRYYYADVLTPIPHVILAFISIDRFLKIVHPRKFLLRNKTSFKYCFCLAATMFNIFYYIPDLLFYGLDTVQNDVIVDSLSVYANQSSLFETKISCKRNIAFLNYLNFLNDAIIPLGITTIFTILLIKSIYEYESRKRAR